MYIAIVAAFMFVLPILSIGVESLISPGANLAFLIGKWFVFWAVGMRLFTAGLRQIFQPAFTAKTIFDIKDPAAFAIVTELGVSNIAIGVLALASLYFQTWIMPSAIYGLIFYGVAAVRHLGNKHRSQNETVATYSDLWAAVVLAGYLVTTFVPVK